VTALLECVFLVRVDRGLLPLASREALLCSALRRPRARGQNISGRLYCTRKALWKLNWFLRDFGYDTDLLGRHEVDERSLLGLTGVVRTSRMTLSAPFLNLDGFTPAGEWEELTPAAIPTRGARA
jgi:hypothetical protein